MDIETGDTVGFLVFSGGVQEIFSVQLVPFSHPALLDINDPLLHTSYSIPDEAIKDFTPPYPKLVEIEETTLQHRQGKFEESIKSYKTILNDETQSTWYPNTEILRQNVDGDWRLLIESAKELLIQRFS